MNHALAQDSLRLHLASYPHLLQLPEHVLRAQIHFSCDYFPSSPHAAVSRQGQTIIEHGSIHVHGCERGLCSLVERESSAGITSCVSGVSNFAEVPRPENARSWFKLKPSCEVSGALAGGILHSLRAQPRNTKFSRLRNLTCIVSRRLMCVLMQSSLCEVRVLTFGMHMICRLIQRYPIASWVFDFPH